MIKFWSYQIEYQGFKKILLKSIDKSIKRGSIFFGEELNKFEIESSVMISDYIKSKKKQSSFDNTLRYINNIDSDLLNRLNELKDNMNLIDVLLYGNKSKKEIMEKDIPQVFERLGIGKRGLNSSYGPTKNHVTSFDIAKNQWDSISPRIKKFIKAVNDFSKELEQLGAPKILD